jgi:hypothetical protein
MLEELAPAGGGQALLHFSEKPVIIVHQMLDCFLHEGL